MNVCFAFMDKDKICQTTQGYKNNKIWCFYFQPKYIAIFLMLTYMLCDIALFKMKEVSWEIFFFFEMLLMSTQNKCFHGEIKKISILFWVKRHLFLSYGASQKNKTWCRQFKRDLTTCLCRETRKKIISMSFLSENKQIILETKMWFNAFSFILHLNIDDRFWDLISISLRVKFLHGIRKNQVNISTGL